MGYRLHPLAAALAVAFSTAALAQSGEPQVLRDVVVSADRLPSGEFGRSTLGPADIQPLRAATSDTASLLDRLPGLARSGAGGVSSLPVMHGLADDRLRIKVDGMDLISACANHMNAPLSYIDPTQVANFQVYAGVSPVSVGGDSIGGSILVSSPAPRFARAGEGVLASGELGGFYRSNGDARGANLSATLAGENLSLRYAASTAQSDNVTAARDFKPGVNATRTTAGTHWIAGDEIASSAYKAQNQSLGLAWRLDKHLLDLKLGYQHIPYQGYPNQHMDMTDNKSRQVNLGYTGQFAWGKLEARLYNERTRHEMNFLDDKQYWYHLSGTVPGMPMNTEGNNTGAVLKADIDLSPRDLLRLGGEYQRYRLDDWWPASYGVVRGVKVGGMQPDTFWNINNGQRDRFDLFAEWEGRWSPQWTSLLGIRGGLVRLDSGTVQGYNSGYNADASRFNAADRERTDHHLDLSALLRYAADANQSYEAGFARKNRSPSLYERYTWSTGGMAMTMNNWVNDGNGYVGNLDLRPETAHTLSFTADWHDAAQAAWGIRLTPYYSLVDDYIDARCAPGKICKTGQFNYLGLVNQDARIYGLDLAAFVALGRIDGIGAFTARGVLGYVNGKNRTSGDHLYNIMPLNARLTLEHRLGSWTNVIEEVLVSGKDDVSEVRQEMRTKGYGLLNLRSSYEWQHVRVDIGVDNVFDQFYAPPLGGAYIGQGTTMSLNGAGAPWGIPVPGHGRSFYAGLNLRF